jgi:hypothetical protein
MYLSQVSVGLHHSLRPHAAAPRIQHDEPLAALALLLLLLEVLLLEVLGVRVPPLWQNQIVLILVQVLLLLFLRLVRRQKQRQKQVAQVQFLLLQRQLLRQTEEPFCT